MSGLPRRRLHPVVAAAVAGDAAAVVLVRLAGDPRLRWIAEAVAESAGESAEEQGEEER